MKMEKKSENQSEKIQNFKKAQEKASDGLVVQTKNIKSIDITNSRKTVKIPGPCVDRGNFMQITY
jgi:hypothetical protein